MNDAYRAIESSHLKKESEKGLSVIPASSNITQLKSNAEAGKIILSEEKRKK